MSPTPVPYLRFGFAVLAVGISLAIWTGGGMLSNPALAAASIAAFVATVAAGEMVTRSAARRSLPVRARRTRGDKA